MPLVKLWNSLRRRSKEPSSAHRIEETVAAESPRLAAVPEAAKQQPTESAKPPKTSSMRRLFGGGPHSGLCRQLKGLEVASVLEISVGDGTRALAVMQTLGKQCSTGVRYSAIDQFELGGGEIALKDFYRLLREHAIQPKLFPEAIDSGLRTVANTIGAVDLVLIALPAAQWQNPVTLHLLARMTHRDTIVLFAEGEDWQRYQPESTVRRRAA